MSTRKPSNSQSVESLNELQPYLWIARYFNPRNINNRREQIRAIVDGRYVIQVERTGEYQIVDPYYYELLIRDGCLFAGKD